MTTRVVLVGVSGYGGRHLSTLRELHDAGRIDLVALVDRRFDRTDRLEDATHSGFPEAADLDLVLDTVEVDIVVVATPPHTHLALAGDVLRRGLALYLEKPPVPLVQELDVLRRARRGQRVEVGFQHARMNLEVLRGIWGAGLIGEVHRVTAHAALARPDSYYQRTEWAGKWFLDGAAVLDGPLFNPCAHVLHTALMAARVVSQGWQPGELSVECYSVREIDGDDLVAARVHPLDQGPVVVAAATTAADEVMEPAVTLHGSYGAVTVRHRDGEATIWRDGRETTLPPPVPGRSALERAVADPRGEGDELLSLDAVRPFVLLANAMVEASRAPRRIHDHGRRARDDGEDFQYLPGVAGAVRRVLRHGTLFFDGREAWASAPARIDLRGYSRFHHPALTPHRLEDPETAP